MPIMRAAMKAPPTSIRAKTEPEKKVSHETRKPKKSMSNNNIHGRSSVASYGTEVKFKISFKLQQKKDNSSACFKQDGGRFDEEETLKLLSTFDYIVTMEVCPNMELLYIKFAGIEQPFNLINNPDEEGTSIFQFVWRTTGIEPNLSRHRTDVICAVKFKNFKEIEFRLQAKFYSVKHIKHATWGTDLNSIILDCTAGRGMYNSFVESMKYL